MTTANETTHPADEGRLEPTIRPLSEADWRFVWQVLEGTKLDTPRIRANVESLLAMAEEFEALDLKNHALAREAYTWSKACENASTALHKLRTPHPRLRVEYWTGQWWEPLHGVKLDQTLEALEPAPQWTLDLTPNAAFSGHPQGDSDERNR